MNSEPETDAAIRAEVRAWLMRLELEAPTQRDKEQFDAWCRADARHAAMYARVKEAWVHASALDNLDHLAVPRGFERVGVAFRKLMRSLTLPGLPALRLAPLAGIAVVTIVLVLGSRMWSRPYVAHYSTAIAQMRDIRLPDGTSITLGGDSRVAVHFDSERRSVELQDGEAFFSVSSDRRRPFYVVVDSSLIRVVGTKFDVRRGSADVSVGVLEGIVEVGRAGAPEASKFLNAGQGVSATLLGNVGDPHAIDSAQPGAWRSGRRTYIDTSLREIVADVNRYSRQPIEIADPQIEDLVISVSFRTSNAQQMLGTLALALPVVVDRDDPNRIVLRAR